MGEEANQIKPAEDSRSTAELFALAKYESQHDDEADSEWEAVPAIHQRSRLENSQPEVYQTAASWGHSADHWERVTAAHVLGQLGGRNRAFVAESVALLISMLSDAEPTVVAAAATALGHRSDPAAIPYLLPLRQHPDDHVRFGVTTGLSGFDDSRAIAGLIELSRDTDADVRNWATFGLAQQVETDAPNLREALLARTTDEDHDARGEALLGLALRRDERVVEPLIRELRGKYHGTYAVEAAEAFPLPVFHEYLLPLRALIEERHSWCLSGYDAALAACRPPENA